LNSAAGSFSRDQIQFRNTVRVDLTADDATLLARMKPKTRYNIRLAERRGVAVRSGSIDDLAAFYALYEITSRRDGFLIRPFAYYRDVWARFLAAGRGQLLLADVAGETIAGLFLFVFGPTAWYMYGASGDAHRESMPGHLLQWHAMRLARELGCTDYDMWGAPDQFTPDDRMWGVYRFKVGFGGETVRGLGAYDFAPRPWLYHLYTRLMPAVSERDAASPPAGRADRSAHCLRMTGR
jgi:peptidoglycan pentaglycine glycine transferase (the first glycine)